MLIKIALVVLVFGVGFCAERPSEDEFELFCRILEEADRMLTDVKDYIYDESKDREIVKEMQVLFNATTDNMDNFRKMLWDTKDFFEAHPPPTDVKNRREAHREIGQLIARGEKEIQDSREIAVKVNEKMEEAKLSVLRGLYGDGVKRVPKNEENLTKIQNDSESVFNCVSSANESCGNENETGKTLFNDLFCVCVGEGDSSKNPNSPCHGDIVPPKNKGSNGNQGKWTQLKYQSGSKPPLSLVESIKKIEEICKGSLEENLRTNILGLLKEFEEMIGKGAKEPAKKKIFGHSGRGDKESKVTKCDGTKGSHGDLNENICVDYTKTIEVHKEIPWHNKFKNYTTLMKAGKDLEEKILKNRADLLLLKSKAWHAYNREKDDETSNLDDMNMTSDKKDAMAENKSEAREYIDVSEETTQPSHPSQDAPMRPETPHYHLVFSTETTQRDHEAPAAGGGKIAYMYISSTESSQAAAKKPGEDGSGEPEFTVVSSESATQESASPSKGPSQTHQDPPTQSAKRLREENKNAK